MFLCIWNAVDLSFGYFSSRLWLIFGVVRPEDAGCVPAHTWKTLKKPMGWESFAKFTRISSVAVRVKQGSERYNTSCRFPWWRSTGLKHCYPYDDVVFIFFLTKGQLVPLSRVWNLLQPSSLLPFVRLFRLLHRKPAHSPSRAINRPFSRYGNHLLSFILLCLPWSSVNFPFHNNFVLLRFFSFGFDAWCSLLFRVQRQCIRSGFGENLRRTERQGLEDVR